MPGTWGGDRQLARQSNSRSTHVLHSKTLPSRPSHFPQMQQGLLPTLSHIPLGNIALFFCLRLFSFSIENAKYLEGTGEVSNLKEIIY